MAAAKDVYDVELVQRHKLTYGVSKRSPSRSKVVETLFKVRWLGYTKDVDSWLPLEDLTGCPDLVYRYLERKRLAYQKQYKNTVAGKNGGTVPEWALPPIRATGFKKGFEFVPKGTEYIKKIHKSFQCEGVLFFTVTFDYPFTPLVHVRKDVLDYYFPIPMLLRYSKKGGVY